jgi:hypothetical protein
MLRVQSVLRCCLLLLLVNGVPVKLKVLAAESPGRLSAAVKSLLDTRFPGWEFAEVGDDIRHFIKERVSADARPDLIRGDFDGNGRLDYALLISHGRVFSARNEAIGPKTHLVVLLSRGGKYRLHDLGEPGEYLTLGKKGADGFDFHAGRRFKYRNDAVEVWLFGKAGWAYIYDGGKFRSVYSAD